MSDDKDLDNLEEIVSATSFINQIKSNQIKSNIYFATQKAVQVNFYNELQINDKQKLICFFYY